MCRRTYMTFAQKSGVESLKEHSLRLSQACCRCFKLLASLGGAMGEDPHAHLTNFMKICNMFELLGITPKGIKLTLFPFSLRDEEKQWAYSLEPSEITT